MVKILVVEDSDFFRQSLKALLSSRFPTTVVEEAVDGREALEMIDTSMPDLILMDIKLPGDNGLEITRKVRHRHQDVPIIILTYYDSPEHREAAFECGANHFLAKGTPSEDVLGLVESILREKRPGSHNAIPE
jgi:DNA-binding NarL/FixJ family response regulator